MANIPIQTATGGTVYLASTPITRDGVNENIQLSTVSDPLSGNQVSVTPPGSSGINALAIQGVSGGVAIPVTTSVYGSYNSNITSVSLGTTSTTLLAANANRLAYIIFNVGPAVAYIAYGLVADAVSNFSFSIAPGESQYIDSIPWRGALSGIVSTGSAQIQITELS